MIIVNAIKLVILSTFFMIMGVGVGYAQDNPGFNMASSMSDYERARAFAELVNETEWTRDNPCSPSHTKFMGMRADGHAGYVLHCQDGNEFLIIMIPDANMSVKLNSCFMSALGGGSCEDEWYMLEMLEEMDEK